MAKLKKLKKEKEKSKTKKKKVTKKKGKGLASLEKYLMNEFEMEVEGKEAVDTTPYYIKFKAKALQYMTGGVPGGHMIEIHGESGCGKCLAKGTLVSTPKGPVVIDKLKVGDLVLGYSSSGKVKSCKVIKTEYTGKKLVYPLQTQKGIIANATLEHGWLTCRAQRSEIVKDTESLSNQRKIKRIFVDYTCGDIKEDHAYVLGVLLGDGCCLQRGNRIHISSPDNRVPNKVKDILKENYCYKAHKDNHTYVISSVDKGEHIKGGFQHSEIVTCNYYEKYLKGVKAHKKDFPWKIVDSWDRKSILQFISGLIDTDGSVIANDKRISLEFSSTSKKLIDLYVKCINKVFQVNCGIYEDERDGKRICYSARLGSCHDVVRILKILNPYLITPNKKMKKKYLELTKLVIGDGKSLGVKLGESYATDTYDIQIDNDTHLYILHEEGLITHNSYLLYELGMVVTKEMGGYFLMFDIERAYKQKYGKRVGLHGNKRFQRHKAKTLEKIISVIRKYVNSIRKVDKKCPILIGLDSYAPIQIKVSQEEIEKLDGDTKVKGYMDAKKNALWNSLLRDFIPFIEENGVTFCVLNQTRKKMNVMFGDPMTTNADEAMQFYSTVRLRGRNGKKLKKGKKVIGILPTWETRKNRDTDPYQKTTFKITWKNGIDPWYGLVELLEIEGVIKKVKGKKSKDEDGKTLYQYKKKKYFFNDSNIKEAVEKYPSMLKRRD